MNICVCVCVCVSVSRRSEAENTGSCGVLGLGKGEMWFSDGRGLGDEFGGAAGWERGTPVTASRGTVVVGARQNLGEGAAGASRAFGRRMGGGVEKWKLIRSNSRAWARTIGGKGWIGGYTVRIRIDLVYHSTGIRCSGVGVFSSLSGSS